MPGVRWEHCGGAGNIPALGAVQQLLLLVGAGAREEL